MCPACSKCSLNGNYHSYFKMKEKHLLNNYKDCIPTPLWIPQFSNIPLLHHAENKIWELAIIVTETFSQITIASLHLENMVKLLPLHVLTTLSSDVLLLSFCKPEFMSWFRSTIFLYLFMLFSLLAQDIRICLISRNSLHKGMKCTSLYQSNHICLYEQNLWIFSEMWRRLDRWHGSLNPFNLYSYSSLLIGQTIQVCTYKVTNYCRNWASWVTHKEWN